MSDRDDELQRLRAADPIDHDSLPSSQDPRARELFERITMNESSRLPRRPVLLAAAAAVLALVAGGVALATRDTRSAAQRSATATTATTATTTGAITPAGSIGSCVEKYSLETLQHREVAFDGTVRGTNGDAITFTVNHWYRGGSGDTTTRQGASTLGGLNTVGPGVSLEPGTRLLVAGDGDFAWSCGFTQPYDGAVAQAWSDALAP